MRHRAQLPTVVLTCALALVGCGPDAVQDASSGAARTDQPGTSIPDDFPLSAGMAAPEDEIPTVRTGTGLRDLELCGTAPLRGLGVRDRMLADNSGGEALNTRELVLLGSPEEATELARSFTDLTTACDTVTVRDGLETLTERRGSAFGPSPAATLLQTYRLDGSPVPGAMVIHVVPVGAAVLVTSTYGEQPTDVLEQGVAEAGTETSPDARADEITTTRQVVAAMCVFTRAGC